MHLRRPVLGALTRLSTERVVWLTTLRPDGSPHVTPVWFCYLEPVWWIATAATNVKVSNLTADPRVALALPDPAAPLVAEGRAWILRDAAPLAVVEGFRSKYHGWDIRQPEQSGATHVLVEVTVSRWLFDGSPH